MYSRLDAALIQALSSLVSIILSACHCSWGNISTTVLSSTVTSVTVGMLPQLLWPARTAKWANANGCQPVSTAYAPGGMTCAYAQNCKLMTGISPSQSGLVLQYLLYMHHIHMQADSVCAIACTMSTLPMLTLGSHTGECPLCVWVRVSGGPDPPCGHPNDRPLLHDPDRSPQYAFGGRSNRPRWHWQD